jgi:hypothetical protein
MSGFLCNSYKHTQEGVLTSLPEIETVVRLKVLGLTKHRVVNTREGVKLMAPPFFTSTQGGGEL